MEVKDSNQNNDIPDGVTEICANVFNGCSGLTGELYIPDNVTEIGDYAFNSVLKLSDAGIINGIDGGFAPHEPVSRAQAAKLIYESLEYRDNSLLQ